MKLARYRIDQQDPSFGIVDGDEFVELRGDPLFSGYDATGKRVPMAEAKLLAPVIPRSKIVAVGRNYAAHAAEKGNDVPAVPMLFFKPNTAVIGPGDAIVIPEEAGNVELEAELAIVIGRIARHVSRERWASYVLGYTVANDVSSRTLQAADKQWARAKGFDTFAPLGPVIETELDPARGSITSQVNGDLAQNGDLADMVHGVPELVEFVTSAFTMLPGDVILTGTPAGVRPIEPGDTVTVAVEGIGELTNPVVASRGGASA